MNNTEKAAFVAAELEKLYPDAQCGLWFGGSPFRLFVMGVLSAQCSDKSVNAIAPKLFSRFPDAKSMADSEVGELEECIHTLGLFNSKAKNLRAACRMLVDDFESTVPVEMNDLLKLPGVGRKVANLIRGDLYGLGGIVADTHCIRISGRLGFADGKDPVKTERALDVLIPKDKQSDFCHRMVDFGRDICNARSPKCNECPLKEICTYTPDAPETKRTPSRRKASPKD